MEKTGRSIPSDDAGELAEMGNLLEPFVRQGLLPGYLEKSGTAAKVIDPTHMYRSTEWSWMIVNPDGFLSIEDRLVGLEIKTGTSYRLKEWGGVDGDEVPDTYYCQVQHYMAGTGLDEWWVFGLIGNRRILRIVPRNEAFINRLVAEESRLWELVELNDPLYAPMPAGKDADMEALLALGDPQIETTVDLSEIENLIDQYEQLRVEIQDKKEERESVKQRIIQTMGKSKYGITDQCRVTHSRWTPKRFDQKRLRKEHPDLYEEYQVEDETEASRLFVSNRS